MSTATYGSRVPSKYALPTDKPDLYMNVVAQTILPDNPQLDVFASRPIPPPIRTSTRFDPVLNYKSTYKSPYTRYQLQRRIEAAARFKNNLTTVQRTLADNLRIFESQ